MEEINYHYQQWLQYYNYERTHSGLWLRGLTPAQKLASNLLFSQTLTILNYPQKVTGTLQQYTTCKDLNLVLYLLPT